VIDTEMPGEGQDRAAKARAALSRKIDELAGGDRELAAQLLRDHYRQMQRQSAAKRRQKRAQRLAEELAALERRTGVRFMTEAELLRLAQRKS
jgi:succinate dehydrogenase/fumarate reductase flavoprotein subunit